MYVNEFIGVVFFTLFFGAFAYWMVGRERRRSEDRLCRFYKDLDERYTNIKHGDF